MILILSSFFIACESSASCVYKQGSIGYSCDPFDANIKSASDPLEVTGRHLNGFSDENVLFLSAYMVTITELPSALLQKFFNLKSLSLRNVKMEKIRADSFESCGALEIVTFWDNLLTRFLQGLLLIAKIS